MTARLFVPLSNVSDKKLTFYSAKVAIKIDGSEFKTLSNG